MVKNLTLTWHLRTLLSNERQHKLTRQIPVLSWSVLFCCTSGKWIKPLSFEPTFSDDMYEKIWKEKKMFKHEEHYRIFCKLSPTTIPVTKTKTWADDTLRAEKPSCCWAWAASHTSCTSPFSSRCTCHTKGTFSRPSWSICPDRRAKRLFCLCAPSSSSAKAHRDYEGNEQHSRRA